MIGIYKITSPSKKVYIGQSIDIKKRWSSYSGLHCKSQHRLYNSFLKYGVDKHNFEIVQICNKEQLNELEKYYVDLFQTFNSKHGLNLRDGGGSNGAISNDTRIRMSKSATGRIVSEHTKNKLSIINTGKKASIDTKIKMSNTRIGMKRSEETKQKMSNSKRGKIFSLEHNLKISISRKNASNETNKKIADANKKIILDTQTGIFYLGIKEAAFAYGVNSGTLKNKLSGCHKNNTNFLYV